MLAFISRDLSPASEFRRLLTGRGWEVTGRSLVELSPLPFSELPAVDWLFFSSRNGVRFFFEHLEQEGRAKPEVKWAALGEATALSLKKYVPTLHFSGSGDPAETAAAFKKVAGGKTVLFPGARHSQQSVQRLLDGVLKGIHLEVYDNRPVAEPQLLNQAVLVFTSPMNAQAYFAQQALLPGQQVVAIGSTTAGALADLHIPNVTIAAAPTETALAAAVLGLPR